MHGLIIVKMGKNPKKFLEEARKIKGVTDAYAVFGRFDVVVFIEGRDFPSLKDVAGKVNSLAGIKSTETLPEGD